MKKMDAHNVLTYVLSEQEWYGVSRERRHELEQACEREAQEVGNQYAAIIVQPDAVLSMSPTPKRHKVWSHTFAASDEDAFRDDLLKLRGRWQGKLTWAKMADIAKRVLPK